MARASARAGYPANLTPEGPAGAQLDQNGQRIHWGALKAGDQVQIDYTKYGSKLVVDSLAIEKVARH